MGKAIVLAISAYIITLLAAALAALIVMTVMSPRGCGDLSQALLVMWLAIAALFLASGVTVGMAVRRESAGKAGRVVLLAAYSAALLISYVVIAFGLMVALNC